MMNHDFYCLTTSVPGQHGQRIDYGTRHQMLDRLAEIRAKWPSVVAVVALIGRTETPTKTASKHFPVQGQQGFA